MATLDITGLCEMTVGIETIVSYERMLEGTGDHYFKEGSMVSLAVDNMTGKVTRNFIVSSGSTTWSMIPEGAIPSQPLDYTAYPVTLLPSAQLFYQDTLGLGIPYQDSSWRGFWAQTGAVFGIMSSQPNQNGGLPLAYESNGYVSFWVESAYHTYDYLNAQGMSFPILPAINSTSGVDEFGGYNQAMSTDSEGNIVLFTDYPGN